MLKGKHPSHPRNNRQGEAITRVELRSLETMLLDGKLQKEELEREMKGSLDLVRFIIDLMGLSSGD